MSIVRRSSGSRNERSDRRGTSALGTCAGGENRPLAELRSVRFLARQQRQVSDATPRPMPTPCWPQGWAVPGIASEVNLLGKCERIVDLYAEVPDRALEFSMAKK